MRSTLLNIFNRRHLLKILVISAIKRQNKNNVLGYVWWLLDPLMFLSVYYLVVEIVFKRGGNNQPFVLFLLCGLIPFKFISLSLSQSVTIFRSAEQVIKSITFPKAILPLSIVFTNLIYFIFGFIMTIAAALFYAKTYSCWPSINYIHLIVVIGVMVILAVGLSLFISVTAVYFEDLKNILSHVIKAWYFASPGLYSFDRLPESIRPYAIINPLAGIMNGFREVIMYQRHPYHLDLLISFIIGVIILAIVYVFFRKLEMQLVKQL